MDTHCLRSAFLWLWHEKNRRGRREPQPNPKGEGSPLDKSRLNYSSWVIYLAPGLEELFIYTLRVLVLSRADLRRHVNFVFKKPPSRHPKTPQVFYWAYIFNANNKLKKNRQIL
jgi:hypothetical protein